MQGVKTKISENQSRNWHALYVNSRSEKKVTENLTLRNIHAYTPLVKTMRQWTDRKKLVEFPLLNGYVFVCIEANEQEKTLHTKGVVNFVRSEGKIAIIREKEIDSLKQLVELGYQLEVGAIKRTYKEGDKVKITSGVLKNIEGIVIDGIEGKYIEILLESIGQSIKVKLPQEILIST